MGLIFRKTARKINRLHGMIVDIPAILPQSPTPDFLTLSFSAAVRCTRYRRVSRNHYDSQLPVKPRTAKLLFKAVKFIRKDKALIGTGSLYGNPTAISQIISLPGFLFTGRSQENPNNLLSTNYSN